MNYQSKLLCMMVNSESVTVSETQSDGWSLCASVCLYVELFVGTVSVSTLQNEPCITGTPSENTHTTQVPGSSSHMSAVAQILGTTTFSFKRTNKHHHSNCCLVKLTGDTNTCCSNVSLHANAQ